ncbi:MAG: hypothetical protein KDC67_04220, partial [Ignavibacteriae bacterium]|nr:hypothetical protein [Ignavibacteriota bacterium]
MKTKIIKLQQKNESENRNIYYRIKHAEHGIYVDHSFSDNEDTRVLKHLGILEKETKRGWT